MKAAPRKLGDIPVEVELVDRVKGCRKCQWFWGATPPYGPFLAFDWATEFPPSIEKGPDVPKRPCSPDRPSAVPWDKVLQRGLADVEPAMLRGCRKAPIMTIGINPNLTPFFPGSAGAGWAYPRFARHSSYAYYYRHATVYQQSFDVDALRRHVRPGTETRSPVDGFVSITRGNSHRWMDLAFRTDGDPEAAAPGAALRHIERTWSPEERLAVFAEGEPHGKERWVAVRKGELVAALVDVPDGEEATILADEVAYYTRLRKPLQRFEAYLGATGDRSALSLRMGEDVSMNDMVACASPGWGSIYDLPRERIADNCVDRQRFMLEQLLQSRPRIVLLVSTSALSMFADGFRRMGGQIDLAFEGRDVFDLLEECRRERRLATFRTPDGDTFSTRLVVTPHFSYGDNFEPQSRFNSGDWHFFATRFPEAARALSDRVLDGGDFVGVAVPRADDPPEELERDGVDRSAWAVLMRHHVAPFELIAEALIDEHEHRPLMTEGGESPRHLDRAPGDCSFCENKLWRFPEGCAYGKVPSPEASGRCRTGA